MNFLSSISLKEHEERGFPFDLPLIQELGELNFSKQVSFFIGENGSGKSTLLEALAAGIGLPAIGSNDVSEDPSLGPARRLGRKIRFRWKNKTRRGFFLRAEDFFGFTKRLNQLQQDFESDISEIEGELEGYGLQLAKGAIMGQKQALTDRYGEDLDENSHGESFLKLFQARFTQPGIYLLDEPEAPLSPQRQLALISMIKEMCEDKQAQFIIATHSPILMAFPGASIFEFKDGVISEVPYDETEHVVLTRNFLNNPDLYLRHL
ncbi:MAG: AAA family ATPase [Bacteroidota bacterium]